LSIRNDLCAGLGDGLSSFLTPATGAGAALAWLKYPESWLLKEGTLLLAALLLLLLLLALLRREATLAFEDGIGGVGGWYTL
jgi:hypothetical protein